MDENPTTDPPGRLDDQLQAMAEAYTQVVALIRNQKDPQLAFEDATELASKMREFADSSAELRAETVSQIWRAEELSIGGLAKRIGVSKARADQLLRSARNRQDQEEGKSNG